MALSRSAEKRRAAKKIARGQRALEHYREQEHVKARMLARSQLISVTLGPVISTNKVTISQTQIRLPLKYFGR